MTAAIVDFKAARARIALRKGQPVDDRTPEERREEWLKEWRVNELCKVLAKMWPEDGVHPR